MSVRRGGRSSFVFVALLVLAAASRAQVPVAAPPPSASSSPGGAPASAKPPPPIESRELRIVVAGRPPVVVSTTTLSTLTPVSSTQAGGKAKQYALRTLLDRLVGPGARLVGVADHAGNRSAVDAALLNAPDVVPVVWTNRRGMFKVGFVDKHGRRLDDTVEYRDVVELHVVAAP